MNIDEGSSKSPEDSAPQDPDSTIPPGAGLGRGSVNDSTAHPSSEDLASYLNEELKPDRQIEVEKHLDQGEQCLASLSDLGMRADSLAAMTPHGDSQGDENPDATIPPKSGNFESPGSHTSDSRQIGPYKLLQQIGEGGMGTVWMAEQEKPVRRRVALKLIKSSLASKEIIARFEAERQALAMMEHPNIARVLDAGTTEAGNPYFVMELIKGVPLNEYCDKNELSIRDRLQIMVDVCDAIQHAHQKGILHRDLKPANVLVTEVNEKPVAKVIDFGLAKALEHTNKLTDKTMFTQFGQVVGTLQYMSPEQAEMDSLDIDTRTDIYSLGVMLYELLAGSTPLEKETLGRNALLQVLELIREKEPPRPSTRLSSSTNSSAEISRQRKIAPSKLQQILKGELDWIVMKAIEKDRKRRYRSAAGFGEDIQRFLNNDAVNARPPSTGYRVTKFVQRNKGLVAALTTIGAFMIAAVGVSNWFAVEARNARVKESEQRTIAENKTKEVEAERDRADDEASKALASQRKASNESKRARDSEASAKFQLANARWDANRVAEARDLLDQISKEYRNFEWSYSRRHFLGSDLTCYGHGTWVFSVAISPEGTRIASGSDDGTIKLWDLETGKELTTISGHTERVSSVAFSPDGTRVVSGSYDRTIKLWDAETGKEILTLSGHTLPVNNVTFSSDGTRITSSSLGGKIKFWDVATGMELTTLSGHTGSVYGLAFSPDGARVVSGSDDHTIKLWDAATGKELTTLSGHTQRVSSVAFSPDGAQVASASFDHTLKLWDVVTGKELTALNGHTDHVHSVAFSPDGTRIASGSEDRTIKLWDVGTGKELATLKGHTGTVRSVVFNPDGTRLASGSLDHTIKLWDIATGRKTTPLNYDEEVERVSNVAFSPDGTRVVSASKRAIKLWDVATGQELITIRGNTDIVSGRSDAIRSVAFSPDGTRIVSGSERRIKLWDVTTGKELNTINKPKRTDRNWAWVNSVAFSQDGTRIISGSNDRTTKLWDVATGKEFATFSGHTDHIYTVAVSPDGTRIVSGSGDQTIKLWDAATGKELNTFSGHTGMVRSVACSPDGALLVSGSSDRTIKLWDISTGKELTTLSGHTSLVNSVAFSPDGTRIASASADNTIKLWNAASGKELITFSGNAFTSVAFSPDGTRIVASSRDNTIKIWNATEGKETTTLNGHTALVYKVDFSPEGNRIASCSKDRTIKLWHVATGKELNTFSGHADLALCVDFNPDGTRIASGSKDRAIKLWDADTGKELTTFSGHTDFIVSVAFNPDGTRIASASKDRTIKLWDVASGKELKTFSGHTDFVVSVAFSPDGTRIVSGGKDRKLKLWDAITGKHLTTFSGHKGMVRNVAFSPDGARIYSESIKEKLVWDAESGEQLEIGTQMKQSLDQNVSPDGRWLAFSEGPNVVLVDLEFKNTAREKAYRKTRASFKTSWHREQAEKARDSKDWYATTFHFAWLLKNAPDQAEYHDGLHKAHTQLRQKFESSKRDLEAHLPGTVKDALILPRGKTSREIDSDQALRINNEASSQIEPNGADRFKTQYEFSKR